MSDFQENILSDIVTPPKISSIGKRIAASIADGILLLILFVVMGMLFGDKYETTTTTETTVISSTDNTTNPGTTRLTSTSSGFHLNGWPAFAYMVCWFLLIPFLEGKTGQTLGKKILRIKVLRNNDDPTNIGTSTVRHLFDTIDCFLLIGLIISLTNPKHARIGDLVAGTYVSELA